MKRLRSENLAGDILESFSDFISKTDKRNLFYSGRLIFLESEIEKLALEKKVFESQRKRDEESLKVKDHAFSTLQDNYNSKLIKLNYSENKNSMLMDEINNFKNKIQTLENENKYLDEKMKLKTSELREIRDRMKRSEELDMEKMIQIAKEHDGSEFMLQSLIDNNNKKLENRETISQIKAQFLEMEARIEKKDSIIATTLETIERLKKEYSAMTEEKYNLQSKVDQINKLKNEIEQLKSEKISHEQEIEDLKLQLSHAREALDNKVNEFKHERKKSNQELDYIQTEAEATKSKAMYYKELWTQERDRFIKLQSKINEQQAMFMKKISNQEGIYQDEIKRLKTQVENLNIEKENLMQDIMHMNNKNLEIEMNKEKRSSAFQTLLRNMIGK